jgi:1-acyl-sn-glycerol-3-phosphate acyltransferase
MPLPRALSTALWLPLNVVQGIFTVAWSAVWIPIALAVATLARSTRPALALARWAWAPGLLCAAMAPVEVTGRERLDPRRTYFFVANHASWMDIPALFVALPRPLHFLAKRELARVPLMGRYIRAMGMVFVDRRDARKATASVDRVAELLAAGGSVISFPAGTRSAPGELLPFKSGGFEAAIATGAPVVPIAIRGSGRVIERGGFRVRPGWIRVTIGQPIETVGFLESGRAALAAAAQEAVAELLEG